METNFAGDTLCSAVVDEHECILFFENYLNALKKNNRRRIYHRPAPMLCINGLIAHTKRHRHKSVFFYNYIN